MRHSAWLMVALALGACTDVNPCKSGTVLLTVTRGGAAVDGTTLRLELSLDGGAPIHSMLPVAPGQEVGTVQLEFPSGYPEGSTLTVTVASERGATVLASQSTTRRLGAGCESVSVTLTTGAGDSDLGPSPDFLGIPDACGAMPTYCSGHGVCDNTATGPTCTCATGYTGARCNGCASGYQDNDGNTTCTPNCATAGLTCNNAGTCSDATGTALCTCLTEFTGPTCAQCKAIPAKAIYLFNAGQNRVADFPTRAAADARVTTALPTNLPGLPGATYRARAFISSTGDAIADFPARYCLPTTVPVNGFTPAAVATNLGPTWIDFMDTTIPVTIGAALGYQDFNYFWTGSTNLGAASGHDCSKWTDSVASDASISNRSNVTSNWLNSLDNAGCGSGYLLLGLAYCVANCP